MTTQSNEIFETIDGQTYGTDLTEVLTHRDNGDNKEAIISLSSNNWSNKKK